MQPMPRWNPFWTSRGFGHKRAKTLMPHISCLRDYQDGMFNVTTAKLFDCAGVTGSGDVVIRERCSACARPKHQLGLNICYCDAGGVECAGMALTHEILVRDYLDNGTLVGHSRRSLH